VGNTCVDIVMRHTSELPKWGREQVLGNVEERLGGQGANFAVASARLGTPTWLVSSVGDDDRGRSLRLELASVNNLDCSLLRTESTGTGFSVAVVHTGGDRFFLTFLGHQSRFALEGPAKSISLLGKGDVVHVSGYFLMTGMATGLVRFLGHVKAKGALVSFDPGWNPGRAISAMPESFWNVMDLVDWFLPNEDELAALSSRRSILSAAKVFAKSLKGQMVVKMGSRGCLVLDEGRVVRVKGFKVTAVDSVGAGDAFDAGFLAGLGRGHPLSSCAMLGNAVAALSVSRSGGPSQRFPSMSEVTRFAGKIPAC
jgi:ribokinase